MNDCFSWKLYFLYKLLNCQGRVWGHWLCHSHTHIKNHYRTPKSALKFFGLLTHSISFLSQKGVQKINFLVQVGKSKSLAKHHIPCTVVAPVFQPNHLNMTYHHHHHCRATLSRPHYSKAGHVESSSGAPNTLMVGNNCGSEQCPTKVWLKRGICIGGWETMGAAMTGRPSHLRLIITVPNHVAVIVSCYQGKYWVAWVHNNTLATTGRWRWRRISLDRWEPGGGEEVRG